MANGASIQLKGHEKLLRKFNTLSAKMQRDVVRKSVNAGATQLVKAVRAKAPKDTGELRDSIGSQKKANFAGGRYTATVGPRTSIKWSHPVSVKGRPGKKRLLPVSVIAKWIEYGFRGIPAKPFMRPAFDANRKKIAKAITTKMVKELRKALRKTA